MSPMEETGIKELEQHIAWVTLDISRTKIHLHQLRRIKTNLKMKLERLKKRCSDTPPAF